MPISPPTSSTVSDWLYDATFSFDDVNPPVERPGCASDVSRRMFALFHDCRSVSSRFASNGSSLSNASMTVVFSPVSWRSRGSFAATGSSARATAGAKARATPRMPPMTAPKAPCLVHLGMCFATLPSFDGRRHLICCVRVERPARMEAAINSAG